VLPFQTEILSLRAASRNRAIQGRARISHARISRPEAGAARWALDMRRRNLIDSLFFSTKNKATVSP
jgi:hypothetical protein